MSNLKELTWEHHKNAERQEFVKELMSGKITKERYATLLFNLHPQYNILETFARMYDLVDIRQAPRIHADYHELWDETKQFQPKVLPVVKEWIILCLFNKSQINLWHTYMLDIWVILVADK